jgi:hypothetical protein
MDAVVIVSEAADIPFRRLKGKPRPIAPVVPHLELTAAG